MMAPNAAFLLFMAALAGASAQGPEDAPAASTQPAPAAPAPPPENRAAEAARALYFVADVAKAADAFEKAVKVSSRSPDLLFDAAIAVDEAGRGERAVELYRLAAELAPESERAERETALGMALLRQGRAAEADEALAPALARAGEEPWTLLAAGRAKLALGRHDDAADLLRRAADAAPGLTPADFYLGRALELKGDQDGAAEAYRKAVAADSYFTEGRGPLTQAYLRLKRHNDAMRQLLRWADAEPGSKMVRKLIDRVRPLMTRSAPAPAPGEPSAAPAWTPPPRADTEVEGRAPVLRVGVSTTPLGRVRPRRSAGVRSGGSWKALDPKTGRVLAHAEAGEVWTARIVPPKKKKGRARLELHGPQKRVAAAPGDAVKLVLDEPAKDVFQLVEVPEREKWEYRGELEIALHGGRRSLRLVNIVGMEDYVHGVVSAEMPNRSPLEALKAQAVMARTHVYYLKTIHRFRHKKEGYDICDEQHCQVYAGQHAETERTRAVVQATRGLVATYNGRPAQVIYSSHCGGATQSGKEVGWGDVPYWTSVEDVNGAPRPPRSPSDLRRALARWPPDAFCRPSAYVHASHTRWTRVIPARALEEKLAKKLRIGRLKGLRVLKRARSGHVNALLVLGTRRNHKLTDELEIRSLLGVGSLRSTFFVVDHEYKPEPSIAPRTTIGPPKGTKARRPAPVKLQLDALVFRGGGWGHGVGFCQSGAMGRAEAGQDHETIIRTYFRGIGLSRLDY